MNLDDPIEKLELPCKSYQLLKHAGINLIKDAIELVRSSQNDYFGESLAVQDARVSLEDAGVDWHEEAAEDQA